MAKDVCAVLITIDRSPQPNYLEGTLENLTRSDLFSSERLARFLVVAPNDSRGWAESVLSQFAIDGVADGEHPANLNVARALEGGADASSEWVLFLEDDIDVCHNFFDSVSQWLDDNARDDRRVYAFGANFGQVGDIADEGFTAWDYPIELFYGTQAIALRRQDAISFAGYLRKHCYDLDENGAKYDHLMRAWAKEEWPEIDHFLASCPSFVQHTGRTSIIDPREIIHVFPSWPGRQWSYAEGWTDSGALEIKDSADHRGVKTVAILTPFRNSRKHLNLYFKQLSELRKILGIKYKIRLVAAEGDSVDGTRDAILNNAHLLGLPIDLVPTDHGKMRWGSVEDADRLRTMSNVMNAALSAVEPDDDVAVWIMSDLEWSASTVADMIEAAIERRDGFDVFAPLVFQDGNFYDTWGYRADGERFKPLPPYHPKLKPSELTEVDSAGTCLVMRSEVARVARATKEEAVSWCADARRHGARVAVNDQWRFIHDPASSRKLLFLGDAVVPTGFSRCTHGALPELINAGWEVDVIGVNYGGIPHDYPFKIWPAAIHGKAPFGEQRLANLLAMNDYDAVVLLTDPWHIPNYMNAIEAGTEGKDTPPVLGWLAADSRNQKGKQLNELSHVVSWTQFGIDEFRRGGYEGPVTASPLGVNKIYEPVDKSLARSVVMPDELPEDAFIVGFIGRNQLRKRIDLLIEYFAEWVKRYEVPDAYLYIQAASTGSSGGGCDIQAMVKHHGIGGRVLAHEAANLTEQQMAAIYSALDVFLTTTQGEGWGLPVAESMACGTPCIVPDWSALGEWTKGAAVQVQCTSTALTAPLNALPYTVGGIPDKEATVQALQSLYSDDDLREKYAEKGLNLAAELTWERTGKELAAALEEMMADHEAKVTK